MATDPLARWWTIPIDVERLDGSSAYEESWHPPATVLCRLRNEKRLVRDADGNEVVSTSQASMPLNTAHIPVGSRVTIRKGFPDATQRTVIAEARHEAAGTPNFYSIDLD